MKVLSERTEPGGFWTVIQTVPGLKISNTEGSQ